MALLGNRQGKSQLSMSILEEKFSSAWRLWVELLAGIGFFFLFVSTELR